MSKSGDTYSSPRNSESTAGMKSLPIQRLITTPCAPAPIAIRATEGSSYTVRTRTRVAGDRSLFPATLQLHHDRRATNPARSGLAEAVTHRPAMSRCQTPGKPSEKPFPADHEYPRRASRDGRPKLCSLGFSAPWFVPFSGQESPCEIRTYSRRLRDFQRYSKFYESRSENLLANAFLLLPGRSKTHKDTDIQVSLTGNFTRFISH